MNHSKADYSTQLLLHYGSDAGIEMAAICHSVIGTVKLKAV